MEQQKRCQEQSAFYVQCAGRRDPEAWYALPHAREVVVLDMCAVENEQGAVVYDMAILAIGHVRQELRCIKFKGEDAPTAVPNFAPTPANSGGR